VIDTCVSELSEEKIHRPGDGRRESRMGLRFEPYHALLEDRRERVRKERKTGGTAVTPARALESVLRRPGFTWMTELLLFNPVHSHEGQN
jgi:hypothetical protein